jgi:hypothetical protein
LQHVQQTSAPPCSQCGAGILLALPRVRSVALTVTGPAATRDAILRAVDSDNPPLRLFLGESPPHLPVVQEPGRAGRCMYHSVNSRHRPAESKRITKQLSYTFSTAPPGSDR